jgi:uncharacterized protein YkwD
MVARPALAAMLVIAGLAVVAPQALGDARSNTACPYANTSPSKTSLRHERAAVLCLLNEERTARGLSALTRSGKLARAASRHSRSMVRHGYFDHQRPGGPGFAERIQRSGYASGARRWEVGENLAWATGNNATPAAIVTGWMRSGDHRHNVLDSGFDQVGLGIARGTPTGSPRPRGRLSNAMVVTADFGSRS